MRDLDFLVQSFEVDTLTGEKAFRYVESESELTWMQQSCWTRSRLELGDFGEIESDSLPIC